MSGAKSSASRRLFGLTPVAVSLLVIAALVRPVMLIAVLRHLTRRAPGAVFLICVATQGLAVMRASSRRRSATGLPG
ncbi:hypothetical protein [Streptomyces sp. NPDC052494]|uniref:hypothetical protein n=1 Tax=Streptomyces sp. NPDC052494 TaxID=3365692 RepID=UPI0037D990A4